MSNLGSAGFPSYYSYILIYQYSNILIFKGDDTFSEQGLAAMLREIFIIGAESESVMMRWVFRILSCNPQVNLYI